MDTMDNINNNLENSAETSYGSSSNANAKSFETTEVYRYYQKMMYDEEEEESEESGPKLNDFGDPNNIIDDDDDYDQQQQQHYIVRCFKCGDLGHKRSDCLADFDDHQDMELLSRYSSSGGDADTSSSTTTITLDEKYLQEMLLLAESFLPKYLKKSLEKVKDDDDGDDVGGR